MEIERRFRLPYLPKGITVKPDVITQAYLSLNPEVRVRSVMTLRAVIPKCFLTIKTGKGLHRQEFECSISESCYLALSANKPWVKKLRYELNLYEHIDVYPDLGLCILECEFASEMDSLTYSYPDVVQDDLCLRGLIIADVTDNIEFNAQSLAR